MDPQTYFHERLSDSYLSGSWETIGSVGIEGSWVGKDPLLGGVDHDHHSFTPAVKSFYVLQTVPSTLYPGAQLLK